MNFLLDTCVVSDQISKRPHPGVTQWLDSIDPDSAYLSVLSIGEIQKGIEKLQDVRRREALESWLEEDLLVRFRDRLVDLDVGIVRSWGTLTGRLEAQGITLPAVDSLLAATALHRRLVLVTRNEADFVRSGVQILNPWKSPTG